MNTRSSFLSSKHHLAICASQIAAMHQWRLVDNKLTLPKTMFRNEHHEKSGKTFKRKPFFQFFSTVELCRTLNRAHEAQPDSPRLAAFVYSKAKTVRLNSLLVGLSSKVFLSCSERLSLLFCVYSVLQHAYERHWITRSTFLPEYWLSSRKPTDFVQNRIALVDFARLRQV